MKSLALLWVVLAGCTLDPSTKPECVEDDHCYYSVKGHCVEQVCVRNVAPTAQPDVYYVSDALPATIVISPTENDVDPEGDAIRILEVTRDNAPGGWVRLAGQSNIEIQVTQLPSTYAYRIGDTYDSAEDWTAITLAALPPQLTFEVEAGTSVSLMPVFSSIVDTTGVELVTPPAHGVLQGTLPDLTYVPATEFCGSDLAVYRVTAGSGSFDLAVRFEVGLLLVDDERIVELGGSTTVDVLANDRPDLEIIATTDVIAAINDAKDALVVTPPTNAAGTREIGYTARDARGCTGDATLELVVEYPTQVLVGQGMTGDAFDAVQSNDGRFVAFTSADTALVNGDTNGAADVFVLDTTTGAFERVSVASNGAQANESSGSPTISADGRWVAFTSRASNLVAADTTSVEDIYLHDRTTGTTTLVSVSLDNTGSDQASLTPHISANGSRITFASSATRLVTADTNDVLDVFVRDIATSTTTRVSLTSAGAQLPFTSEVRPRISGNGRYVALSSQASLDGSSQNGGAFLIDTTGSALSRISQWMGEVDVDDAGRFVAYSSGTVTVVDRVVENSTSFGSGTFPTLSGDGQLLAFRSANRILARGAGAPVDVIVDRAGTVVAVTPLRRPELSGDGRWIVFATSEWPGHLGRFVIVRVWNRAY